MTGILAACGAGRVNTAREDARQFRARWPRSCGRCSLPKLPRGDYEIHDDLIVFAAPIIKETVTPGRWMAMYLGLFGTYRKNETVDVEYHLRGETKLAADVEILPDP